MKKYLPKTSSNPEGFTLIELLVVIAIIAVLAVIGIALFSSVQSRARDSKRVQDITAMSKAMEVNYVAGSGYPTAVSTAWFADQVIPTNPGPGGASYATNALNGTVFTFCATLENSTGNAASLTGTDLGTTGGGFFCKKNSQ